jgi:hypothetical protein
MYILLFFCPPPVYQRRARALNIEVDYLNTTTCIGLPVQVLPPLLCKANLSTPYLSNLQMYDTEVSLVASTVQINRFLVVEPLVRMART